jgi:hypothetical protein
MKTDGVTQDDAVSDASDAALAARADRRIHIVDGKVHETTFGGDRKPEAAGATGATECQS